MAPMNRQMQMKVIAFTPSVPGRVKVWPAICGAALKAST